MSKTKLSKPSAKDRRVPMFQEPVPESIEEDAKAERLPIEQDVDRMRDNAFKYQEWTSKYFASLDATGNEYRVSYRDRHYYIETVLKKPGTPTAYGYTGIMIREEDLLNLTTTLVLAARAKQKTETK